MHFFHLKPPGCGSSLWQPGKPSCWVGGQRPAHPCLPRATPQRPVQEADVGGVGMIPSLAGRPWQLTSSLRASVCSSVQWAHCSPCPSLRVQPLGVSCSSVVGTAPSASWPLSLPSLCPEHASPPSWPYLSNLPLPFLRTLPWHPTAE